MSRTILIVDDISYNRAILKKILGSEYDILEACNGLEAVEVVHQYKNLISAVLMDLAMPVMDGFEAIEMLRADGELSQIPIIVTTGETREAAEVRALTLGANDYISKPYNSTIIKQRIRNTIRLRETSATVNALQRDKLTGLYNRETFFGMVETLATQQASGYYAMTCFDIVSFKVINDRYGTLVGDEVLKHIAYTFRAGFERVGGVCSRITEDNFAVFYPASLPDKPDLADIVRRASHPAGVQPVTFTIGRYVVADLSLSASAMYDRAAMAERSIGACFDTQIATYDESMRESILKEQEITEEMNTALAQGRFEAWLQPQYNHSTGALIGAEALARWCHPTKGILQPSDFVPVFERNGFIYELDKSIWRQACDMLAKWRNTGAFLVPVSVNISRFDILRNDFFEVITGLVEEYDIPVQLLKLEVTEFAFAENTDDIIEIVKRLKAYGFIVQIDDFGSGYSSLNTLKDVPADVLKLDMRFLEDSGNNSRGGNILESIVRMAKWLGMHVIAEGVETRAQADFLLSIGCSYVQGFFYARPMPLYRFERLAASALSESESVARETVETFDNNAFWDPSSMDTLIFNSYVGGACIFEYINGSIELLRVNRKYAVELLGDDVPAETAMAIEVTGYMDSENCKKLTDNIEKAIETGDECTTQTALVGLPGRDEPVYIRATVRVIAKAGARYLLYGAVANITAQIKAEKQQAQTAAHLQSILQNVHGGVSAATLVNGAIGYIFVNDMYYSMLGYTKEQFEREVPNGIKDLIHPDNIDFVMDAAHQSEKTGKPFCIEYRVRRRDGSLIWVRSNGSVCAIQGYDEPVQLAVSYDVTKELEYDKQLLAAAEQLRFLNETAHELLARPDADAAIDGVLSKVLAYFGGRRAYIIETDGANSEFSMTYEACAEGVKGKTASTQHSPFTSVEYWLRVFAKNSHLYVDDGASTDGESRLILNKLEIHTLLAVPLMRDGSLIGVIGVDDLERHREHIKQLEAIGDYISVMLTRRDLNAKIASDGRALASLMNDTPGGFVRMRVYENGNAVPVYVNEGFGQMVGMAPEAVLRCYSETVMCGVHPSDVGAVQNAVDELLTKGEARSEKHRLLHGGGDYVWTRFFARAVKDTDGNTYANVYYTDLSESEKRELSVRETISVALAAMMDYSTDQMFVKDTEHKYICCSRAFASEYGLADHRDIVGMTPYDLVDEKTAKRFNDTDKMILESGMPKVDFIEPLSSKDGTPRYVSASKYLLHDSFGNAVGIFGVARDVTDTRTAQERLKLLSNNIPGGIAMYELTDEPAERSALRILYFSDGYYGLTGYTKEEYEAIAQGNPVSLVFEEDLHVIGDNIRAVLNGADSFEYKYRAHHKDGGFRWLSVCGNVSSRNDRSAIVNVIKLDVTAQMLVEDRLRVSEQEMKLAMSQMGKTVCVFDPKTRTMTLPENYASRHGVPSVLCDPLYSVNSGETARRAYTELFDAIMRGEKTGVMETLIDVEGCEPYWERAEFFNIFDSEGNTAKAIVSLEDTTYRHNIESEARIRRENERMWQLVAEHSNRIMCRYDIETRTVCLEAASGKNPFALGSNLPESAIENGVVLPESADDFRDFFTRMHDGTRSGDAKIHLVTEDGVTRWMDMKYSLFNTADGVPTAVISFLDITADHEKQLAYDRYVQTINDNSSSDTSFMFFEADITLDVTEKRGGRMLPMELPLSACSSRTALIDYFVEGYVVGDDQQRCRESFSREHLITKYSDGVRTLTDDWSMVFPNGSTGYMRSEVQMVQDPFTGHIKAYTKLRDITSEKRAELTVKRQAERDGMTGLYNKSTTEEFIKRRLARADGAPCALVIIDLDDLKGINDSGGHFCGDDAIKKLSSVLRTQFRRTDIAGRIGGDEFAVFLDGTGGDTAIRNVLEALQKRLSALMVSDMPIHGSMGAATGQTGKSTYEELFRKADKALYHVKRNGKNDFAIYVEDMG